MYRIKLTVRAKRELKNLKKQHSEAVSEILNELKDDPFIGKPLLRELAGKYSYKVGVYRIIYVLNQKDSILHIITIGHRSVVYR